MRILVVGKGAIGGYYGGRLLEAGEDVTFLVRKKTEYLEVESIHGNLNLPIKTIQAGEKTNPFDLVLLTTKAYHLNQVLTDLKPYISQQTTILPLLNGYFHLKQIAEKFPNYLGGVCFIESTLDSEGRVIQTSQRHDIVFGEINGEISPRVNQLAETFSKAKFKSILSHDIKTAMWNKYVFIAGLSGITTLMYSSIGPILESPFGWETYGRLLNEISEIAKTQGVEIFSPEKNMEISSSMGPAMKASMLRDMEKGLPIEANHIQGELLRLAEQNGIETPLLKAVYSRLKIYEQTL
ncbi:MAG TPA: ketopantoate reductase family protein [Bacillota bacterium]|nr:ketopantoate reductase family protein [Bacillota bacterium]